MENIVTPWEVKGDIDYDRLIEKFGVSPLSEETLARLKQHTGDLHHFLRRKIFFAHRDLDVVLDEYEKGNEFFLYTGRAPSGNTHMGHVVPWLLTKWLQDKFDAHLWFQFPDEEKYLFKDDLSLEDVAHYVQENMLDVIALGFDPEKTHFLIDTHHAGIMYPEAVKVAKRITYSTVKATFGLSDADNIGSIFYTAMQAVPAFLPNVLHDENRPCLIPHAIDQDPHFRVSRDVIPKLGYHKPASIQCRFLPGLKGMKDEGKMSSSGGGHATIYTTDDKATVKKKINKYAFSGGKDTLDEHREEGGDPDIDVSYQWLTFFEEDDAKLKQVYDDYSSGDMLSGELKQLLIENINDFLATHQERRARAKEHLDAFIYDAS
jgi:tryptophanyl-tRNA synthetase